VPAPDVTLVAPYPTAGQRHAGPSGVASYTANLAHALSDRGLSIDVVAPREPDAPDEPAVSHDGPIVVRRSFERGSRGLASAASAALATRAPVVHLQHEMFLYGGPSAIPAMAPALHALRRKARSVVTMHQVVDPRTVDRAFTRLHRVRAHPRLARHALGSVQRSIASLAGACIVHEHAFADSVPGSVVIPHGVEQRATPTRAVARRDLGLDDRLVVLCFGFLAPYKGLEATLDAGRLVGADEALVVVAGGAHPRLAADGDRYGDGLRQRYGGTGTRFTGWVPEADVACWYAAADVAVFAYPAPFSSSGALALAFAHGTPVLLSPPLAACVGAGDEVTTPVDPAGLAARLRELRDPAMRRRLTEASAELARQRAWPDVADAHIELYEQLSI
jgi:glycosyltransferase involved in cell wall biosynthesis